jgi:hypothetical protein
MVFIALPALQRNQRDTQRKNDIGRASSAITTFQSNNRGKLPTATATAVAGTTTFPSFISKYVTVGSSKFEDPQAGDYTFEYYSTTTTTPSAIGKVLYGVGTICGDDGSLTTTGANARNYAISVKIEGGVAYCQSNE